MNEMLGNRIKSLRKAKQMSQEFVAEKIGVSRQKYARIENGISNITLDILSKIAGVFDITVGDITRVLDETPSVAFRLGDANVSSNEIFDMLDLFYANKSMYKRLTRED
ncbi:TPA: helix-turn-helix transcriptional regulator [Streptococcus suis]